MLKHTAICGCRSKLLFLIGSKQFTTRGPNKGSEMKPPLYPKAQRPRSDSSQEEYHNIVSVPVAGVAVDKIVGNSAM
ncbi:unnamed protein product [Peniophora sp. CBMAI 1063]|nr:unnamed protein product [Peniophora sp. CBMAI 1063]